MNKEELFEKPQYLGVEDICKIFNCNYAKACNIIRAIKSVSDRTKLKGKVTVTDYEAWYNATM